MYATDRERRKIVVTNTRRILAPDVLKVSWHWECGRAWRSSVHDFRSQVALKFMTAPEQAVNTLQSQLQQIVEEGQQVS
jgi:hypothetical protein